MPDIFLDLPDHVAQRLARDAEDAGQTVEDYARAVLEASLRSIQESDAETPDFANEPVVKAAEIEIEYRRLGYSIGWRFANCPWSYAKSAKLLLVSLNPGGHVADGPHWPQELGSAYRIERSKGLQPGEETLQKQVLALFDYLSLRDDEVFSAYYVPLRSPSWDKLKRRDEALDCSRSLWHWLMPQVGFDRIVTIGHLAGARLAGLLGATADATIKAGWGMASAKRYRLPDGRPIIALPHLSRYQLFGRPEGRAALDEIFDRST